MKRLTNKATKIQIRHNRIRAKISGTSAMPRFCVYKSNTSVSIFWAIYAAILTAVGFAKRSSSLRIFGLTLFIITAVKIFIDVWSLGTIYRIISFIGLGVIALVASFVYVKYKDRLKVI